MAASLSIRLAPAVLHGPERRVVGLSTLVVQFKWMLNRLGCSVFVHRFCPSAVSREPARAEVVVAIEIVEEAGAGSFDLIGLASSSAFGAFVAAMTNGVSL